MDGDASQQMSLPALREDIRIYEGPCEPDGSPSWTLYDAAGNRFFRIGWLEFECVSRLPRFDSAEDIARSVSAETALSVSAEEVKAITDFLTANELVLIDAPGIADHMSRVSAHRRQSLLMKILHHYLFFMVPLFRPEKFLRATLSIVSPLLNKTFFLSMMLLLALGIIMTLGRIDEFFNTFLYFFTWQGIAFYAATIIGVKIIHELSHAYIATKYGVRVSSMGVAFMVLYPVMFTETTGAWKITDRRKRMMIGIGGVMAELCIAALALMAWHILPDSPARSASFFVATVSLVGSVLVNLNPLMRFDGYYLFSDALGVDNLQTRAFDLAKWRLRGFLFGWDDDKPDHFAPHLQAVVLLYAYATWIYRLFLFLGIAWLVYTLFFQPLGTILMLVELTFFIALPVWYEIRIWMKGHDKMTAGLPAIRTALLVLLLAGWAFVPWQAHVAVPAVMQAGQYSSIYSSVPAKLSQLNVRQGERVSEGVVLAVLESPDLVYRVEKAKRELDKLKTQYAQQARSESLIRSQSVLEQRIAETKAALSGLQEQEEKLSLTAPFDGEVGALASYLHHGRWIDSETPLFQIVNGGQVTLHGYGHENDISRFVAGSEGVFYPDSDIVEPFAVRIKEIGRNNVTTLEWPALASTYGGPVAVDKGDNGVLKPHDSIYKITFEPATLLELQGQTFLLRGTVRLQAGRKSPLQKWLQSAAAMLKREFGI